MIRIDASKISDSQSFHDVFAEAFGFPAFYGRNMDAWIDCLSYLDQPSAGMSTIHVAEGTVLPLVIDNAAQFKARCPGLFADLVECAAFVNWRVIERGGAFTGTPLLALAFHA